MILFFILSACKKEVLVDPKIIVDKVYIEAIKSDRIDVNYSLSELGYQETGAVYFKKTNPNQVNYVNAVRVDGKLKFALQNLEANSDYVFKIFFQQNNERKIDSQEYTVKTLSTEALAFGLQVKSPSVQFDDDGNFTMDIEGDHLNNLNLTELELKVGFTKLSFGYPVLVSGNKYKITVKGKVNPINANYSIIGSYQGKEVLFQSVPFVYNEDRLWLTFKPTNLRGYDVSVFNADLYYFYDNKVFRWDDATQRMVAIGAIPVGTIQPNSVGLQFEGQLFFPVTPKTIVPDSKDLADFYIYPEAYSYDVANGKWTVFPFLKQQYGKRNRMIENAKYFIHKNELYFTYSLRDGVSAIPTTDANIENFLFHYNKVTKQFESISFNKEIIYYGFVSINNQMYLTGLVPVYDQGFKVSATFAVFKVSDNFTFTEIYRGGTVANPLTLYVKHSAVYDQKILIGLSISDFLLFDPVTSQLSKVYLKTYFNHNYLGSFFIYNNKLHLSADFLSYNQKSYEISINKGR